MLILKLILLLLLSNQKDHYQYTPIATAELISSTNGKLKLPMLIGKLKNDFVYDLEIPQPISMMSISGPDCNYLETISVAISNSTNPKDFKLTHTDIKCDDVIDYPVVYLYQLGYAKYLRVTLTLNKYNLNEYGSIILYYIKFYGIYLPPKLIDGIKVVRRNHQGEYIYRLPKDIVTRIDIKPNGRFNFNDKANFPKMDILVDYDGLLSVHHVDMNLHYLHNSAIFSVQLPPGSTLPAFALKGNNRIEKFEFYEIDYMTGLQQQTIPPNVIFSAPGNKKMRIYRMEFNGLKSDEALTGYLKYTNDGITKILPVVTIERSLVFNILANNIVYVGSGVQEIEIYFN